MGFEMLKVTAILLVILGGMYALLRFLKQRMLPRKGIIELIHYQALGPKRGIAIVKVAKDNLVLGVSDQNISLLTKMSSADLEESLRHETPEETPDSGSRLKDMLRGKFFLFWLPVACCLLLAAHPAQAAPAPAAAGGGQFLGLSTPMELLLFLTLLSLLPSILVMVTSFTRIVVVLSFLRQALGTPQVPPSQVVIGLALFTTFFIMSPVLDKIYDEAYVPYTKKQINAEDALSRASIPLKEFMLRQTKEKELAFFLKLSKGERPAKPMDLPLKVVVPAFAVGELNRAFEIGFLIFLPFLVIDMVVSSILLSMGMMMLPPSMVSMPFKLLLFVLVDGWQLIIGSLVAGFK